MAIEPIAKDKLGRVVFAGVVAARVNVQETGINMLMLPILVARFSSRNPTGRPRSYGDATRINQALNGLSFALESRADPAFLIKVPSGGILVAQVWRLVQPIAISFSSTILGLSNPFESRMVKAFASSLATRVHSAFEVPSPTMR